MKSSADVTPEWLAGLLQQVGYDVETGGDGAIRARHQSKPNMVVKLRKDLGLITIMHFWSMKKVGFGASGKLMEAINRANSISWRSTFFRDKDGDLGVSSCIPLSVSIADEDVLGFLDRTFEEFLVTVSASGLSNYLGG